MARKTNRATHVAPAPAPQAALLALPAPAAPSALALAYLARPQGAPVATTLRAPTAAVVTPLAPVATGRGAATAARWGACGKGVAGFTVTMPAAIKALPATTLLTCNVAQNPKGGASKRAFACYGFTAVGNTVTLGAFAAALTKAGLGGATQAAGHVAWDLNHKFITLA